MRCFSDAKLRWGVVILSGLLANRIVRPNRKDKLEQDNHTADNSD